MKCDCGGTPRRVLKENHKRKRATKICDYNFQRYDRLKKDGLCHLTVENSGHKRPPTIDIAGNESAHRLNKKHMLILELTIKGGVPEKDSNRFEARGPGHTKARNNYIQWASLHPERALERKATDGGTFG